MNILLAGFAENESGSKLLLDLVSPRYYIDKQYICSKSNHWKEELLSRMKHKSYEYLFLVHMKLQPRLEENQVELVTFAKTKEGFASRLKELLEENGLFVKIEEETKEQEFDSLYQVIEGLEEKNISKTECLLINIPQVSKIDVMMLSKLMTKYFETLLKTS